MQSSYLRWTFVAINSRSARAFFNRYLDIAILVATNLLVEFFKQILYATWSNSPRSIFQSYILRPSPLAAAWPVKSHLILFNKHNKLLRPETELGPEARCYWVAHREPWGKLRDGSWDPGSEGIL